MDAIKYGDVFENHNIRIMAMGCRGMLQFVIVGKWKTVHISDELFKSFKFLGNVNYFPDLLILENE